MAWISRYGLPTVPNIQAFFLSYMVKFQDTETCVKENKETGIVVFNNSCFGDIRTSWINNEPFFCLTDVCRSLELDNPSCVTTRLDKKGIVTTYTLTTGGKQKMLFINEPNLYKCIFKSRKKEAQAFQDWVYYCVIPEIRKTGSYGKQMSIEEMRMMVLVDLQSEVLRQGKLIKKYSKCIKELKSQLDYEKEKREQKRIAMNEKVVEDVKEWIESKGISGEIKASTLHMEYFEWCSYHSWEFVSSRKLCSILRLLGYKSTRKKDGLYFIIEKQ